MNRVHRYRILAPILLASSLQGCGCGADRQMVYTAPRRTPVQVNTTEGVRVKAPFVDVHVPASRPLPPSKGIDVPMVEPE